MLPVSLVKGRERLVYALLWWSSLTSFFIRAWWTYLLLAVLLLGWIFGTLLFDPELIDSLPLRHGKPCLLIFVRGGSLLVFVRIISQSSLIVVMLQGGVGLSSLKTGG
jgi:hypothetical protein